MGRTCFSAGCKTGYQSERQYQKKMGLTQPSLFKTPKDPALFEIWKRSIPRADRQLAPSDHLCAKHFKQEDIEEFYETKMPDGSIFRLKRGKPLLRTSAIPCIFPDVPGHSSYVRRESKKPEKKPRATKKIPPSFSPLFPHPTSLPSSSSSILPPTSPLIPPPSPSTKKQKKSGKMKTSSSEKKTKQKKDSSIQVGKENILFEGIILHPVTQGQPSAKPVLFKEREDTENEIDSTLLNLQNRLVSESEFVFINPPHSGDDQSASFKQIDTENEMDAMPSPFQDCSISEPDSPFIDSTAVNEDPVEEYSVPSVCETILTESNVVLPKSVIDEQFSFNFLKININMVDMMNPWWKVNVLDDFISFIRWTPDYTIERKIVITKNLAVKVFLKDRETTIGSDLEVVSIDVISKLIFRVERTKLCPSIHKKGRNCAGFLQGVFQCKKHNLCLNCIKWEREQAKLLMKPVKIPNNLVELIRFNFNE